ncbi:DUF2188 domain-containing protein [Streptomyces sp. BF23-18]|uniref:DUF2188 domain-containing protein n=1 Tax=Streptomyces sp. BF23-18 TaxID=3240282 RepID=UPI0034E3F3B1
MTQRKTYHVTQRPDKKWQAKAEGASRASAVAQTQAAADKRAADLSRNNGGGEVIRHGRDGRIKDKRTIAPGNDPYPPKG